MEKVAILKSHLGKKGGLEKYTLRIASAFSEQGYDVTLLTTHSEQLQAHGSFKIINFPNCSNISYRHLSQFDQLCKEWLQKNPCDIIFGLDRNSYQTHYRAGNGVHAEYLERRRKTDSLLKRISFHINPLHSKILSLEKQAYESSDLKVLFTNSQMVGDEILKHYATDPKKICVVHNGVEWDEMKKPFDEWANHQAQILTELGLDPYAFQFLFIGKGFRRKGLQYLLEGLSKITSRHYQLSVIGEDRETAYFEKMSEDLKIDDKVKFFGYRQDVIKFYQACDVLVIPSIYDPFANVTVEALAMGLFVVSSKNNGGSEILTAESGKIIDDIFNPKEVENALHIALDKTKSLHSSLNIRKSVQHLDFSHQLQKLIETTYALR